MKIWRGFLRGKNADIARQQTVYGAAQIVDRNRIVQVERSHLRQRVDAGIGAAGTLNLYRSAFDRGDLLSSVP